MKDYLYNFLEVFVIYVGTTLYLTIVIAGAIVVARMVLSILGVV